jgi:hypothetical protein
VQEREEQQREREQQKGKAEGQGPSTVAGGNWQGGLIYDRRRTMRA